MNNPDKTELHWNAFRYVADEMSADEQDGFERQLADDQTAREAVVRAVQLTQAVAALPAEVLTSPIQTGGNNSPTRRSVGVWSVAAGLSVCLVLIVGFYFGGMFGKLSVPPNLVSQDELLNLEGAGVLIAIWSDSETALEEFLSSDLLLESGDDSAGLEESEQLAMLAFDETLDEQFNVPDWMLAAVTSQLQARKSSETQPEDN